jgi:hypothetical protein
LTQCDRLVSFDKEKMWLSVLSQDVQPSLWRKVCALDIINKREMENLSRL